MFNSPQVRRMEGEETCPDHALTHHRPHPCPQHTHLAPLPRVTSGRMMEPVQAETGLYRKCSASAQTLSQGSLCCRLGLSD